MITKRLDEAPSHHNIKITDDSLPPTKRNYKAFKGGTNIVTKVKRPTYYSPVSKAQKLFSPQARHLQSTDIRANPVSLRREEMKARLMQHSNSALQTMAQRRAKVL